MLIRAPKLSPDIKLRQPKLQHPALQSEFTMQLVFLLVCGEIKKGAT